MTKTKNRGKIILAAALAALAITATTACYLLLPNAYISLDLNPSIELRTNRLNHVTSMVGLNADAEELLKGYTLRDRDLDDVVEDLVDRMVLSGYLGAGNQAELLVTVEQGKVKPETLEKVNTHIAEYLSYRSVSAKVHGQSIEMDDDLRERAAEQNISAGKLSVIDRLLSKDATLRPDDLRDTKVSDLLAYAKERNVSLDLLEDRLDDLDDRYEGESDKTVDQLEDQLDDLDDQNTTDDLDDLDDLYDDDKNDLDDRYDDDRYDDDHDDNDWDDDDNWNKTPVAAPKQSPTPVQTAPVQTAPVQSNQNHWDDDDNDDWDDDKHDDDNDDWDDDNDDNDDNDDDNDDNDDNDD